MLYQKCCIIILILLLLFLYIYVKKETFDNQNTTIPVITNAQLPISVQLKNEIGRILEISPSRIEGLIYDGDVSLNLLRIDFNIMENNTNENIQNEKSKFEAEQDSIKLAQKDLFICRINNQTVILRPMPPTKQSAFFNKGAFFNNEGLNEISNYANNVYNSVPNDSALTKFYTLDFDSNYKLIPKI